MGFNSAFKGLKSVLTL